MVRYCSILFFAFLDRIGVLREEGGWGCKGDKKEL